MKLQKRWLLGGLAALLLTTTACQKTNNSSAPEVEEGSTYMSVAIDINLNPEELLKAGDDQEDHNGVGHWEGQDKINGVDIYIVDNTTGKVVTKGLNVLTAPAGTGKTAETDGIYYTGTWKVTPGTNMDIYAVVNNSGEIKQALDAAANTTPTPTTTTAEAFKEAYQAAYNYVLTTYAKKEGTTSNEKDIILMSSEPLTNQTIHAGIDQSSATITSSTTDPAKNQFALQVRRSAARVAVTYDNDKLPSAKGKVEAATSPTTKTTLGDIEVTGWYYGQFELQTKVQWDKSAIDKSTPAKTNLHRTTKSPNWSAHNDASTGANVSLTDRETKYDYSTLKTKQGIKALSTGGAGRATVADIIKDGNMQFLAETTHQYGPEDETGYRKGNTPYVLIETVFTPADGSWATDDEKTSYVPGTDGNYPDLYYSTFNGKFYTSLNNAWNANPATAGKTFGATDRDEIVKYTGGKMYYFAWLNPDNAADATKWFNSPVIRNNIYHIHVTGFKKLGMSGDPFNPTDGNDKPVDPDDEVPSVTEKLNIKETWMSCKITVINWGVHSYNISF